MAHGSEIPAAHRRGIHAMAGVAALLVPLVLAAQAVAAEGAAEQARAALAKQTAAVETLWMDYVETPRALVDKSDVLKAAHRLLYHPLQKRLVCTSDGKIYFHVKEEVPAIDTGLNALIARRPEVRQDFERLFEIPYGEIQAVIDASQVNTREWNVVFNNGKLMRWRSDDTATINGVELNAYQIVAPKQFPGRLFATLPTDYLLLGDLLPSVDGLDHDNTFRKSFSSPLALGDRLKQVPAAADAAPNTIDFQDDAGQMVRLDPDRAYSVVQREYRDEHLPLTHVVTMSDFSEPVPGLHFPRQIKQVTYTTNADDPTADPVPLLEVVCEIKQLEINDYTEADLAPLFNVDVPHGSLIIDEVFPLPHLPPRVR